MMRLHSKFLAVSALKKKRGKRQRAAAYAVCATPVERDGGNKGGKQEEGGSFGHIVGFGR
jgi:hypothetical protein